MGCGCRKTPHRVEVNDTCAASSQTVFSVKENTGRGSATTGIKLITIKTMTIEALKELIGLENKDYEHISAKSFELLVIERLKLFGEIKTQVSVVDRGDGRSGRIDIVFYFNSEEVAIEIDRKNVRAKSKFKVRSYSKENAFCITRSPYAVFKV